MQENVSSAYVNNVAIGEFRPLWYLTFEIPLYELNMTAYVELPIFCYEYMQVEITNDFLSNHSYFIDNVNANMPHATVTERPNGEQMF